MLTDSYGLLNLLDMRPTNNNIQLEHYYVYKINLPSTFMLLWTVTLGQ